MTSELQEAYFQAGVGRSPCYAGGHERLGFTLDSQRILERKVRELVALTEQSEGIRLAVEIVPPITDEEFWDSIPAAPPKEFPFPPTQKGHLGRWEHEPKLRARLHTRQRMHIWWALETCGRDWRTAVELWKADVISESPKEITHKEVILRGISSLPKNAHHNLPTPLTLMGLLVLEPHFIIGIDNTYRHNGG